MEESASAARHGVTQLGYLGIATTNLAAWTELCELALECEVIQAGDVLAHVRVDDRQHRLTLRQAEHDGLDYLGWEVAGPAELEQLAAQLQTAGVAATFGDAALAQQRGVGAVLQTADPSGVALEIFHSPTTPDDDFVPRWPHSGFVAGELGLGHAVIATPRYDEAIEFYVQQLGLRVSDYVDHPVGWDATFLRCNRRHHSLAIVRQPDAQQPASLHHFLLESGTLDDVGLVLDKCLFSGIRVTQSLGRHSNDQMVSFYLQTPSGFEIEYGALGRLVNDADWQVTNYASPSIWGHLPREGFTIASTTSSAATPTAQNAYTMGR